MWVELLTRDDKDAYAQFLDDYVMEQKQLGRFPRDLNNRLSTPAEWMVNREVVDDTVSVLLALSVLFLVVCLLNTIGLLLAKVIRRGSDISLRRALGASKIRVVQAVHRRGRPDRRRRRACGHRHDLAWSARHRERVLGLRLHRIPGNDGLADGRACGCPGNRIRVRRSPLPDLARLQRFTGQHAAHSVDEIQERGMDIGPIWRAMLRNKAGFVLIALQVAVTLTIMVNAIGIIQERSRQDGP